VAIASGYQVVATGYLAVSRRSRCREEDTTFVEPPNQSSKGTRFPASGELKMSAPDLAAEVLASVCSAAASGRPTALIGACLVVVLQVDARRASRMMAGRTVTIIAWYRAVTCSEYFRGVRSSRALSADLYNFTSFERVQHRHFQGNRSAI
jgi:hypothetical protein